MEKTCIKSLIFDIIGSYPMRQEIDKIEIKEPPIEELNKKRSCLRRSCGTGCGCFAIVVILSLVLLRFTIGPKTKEVRDIPQTFTEAIPLYDIDNVDSIKFTSGKERGKRIEVAAYFPKTILSPFIIYFDKDCKYIPQTDIVCADMTGWQKFRAFISDPVTDKRDTYNIEWSELHAKQDFIIEYYQTELKKKGYSIGLLSENNDIKQFTFSNNMIDGLIYTMDDASTKDTDFVSLTVNLPVEDQ